MSGGPTDLMTVKRETIVGSLSHGKYHKYMTTVPFIRRDKQSYENDQIKVSQEMRSTKENSRS
jgi:hypothetical protein